MQKAEGKYKKALVATGQGGHDDKTLVVGLI
jgi:hypothetical protein